MARLRLGSTTGLVIDVGEPVTRTEPRGAGANDCYRYASESGNGKLAARTFQRGEGANQPAFRDNQPAFRDRGNRAGGPGDPLCGPVPAASPDEREVRGFLPARGVAETRGCVRSRDSGDLADGLARVVPVLVAETARPVVRAQAGQVGVVVAVMVFVLGCVLDLLLCCG